MLLNLAKKIFGTKNDRDLKDLRPIVNKINELEKFYLNMSDEELQAQTPKFQHLLETNAKTLDEILPDAFALIREASKRVLGMRPFDEQVMGGIVLHQGKISEMKTGEGKTLTATLPIYLNALNKKGAHLVTVNDYLANRDGHEMGKLYTWLGLKVGIILSNMSDEARKEAYLADITYGTNNEFAFDYLRDNMKFNLNDYVQRGHNFCIVDEVDSILIDEARTPLLISGPSTGDTKLYSTVNAVIPQLDPKTDFKVDEKSKTVNLTDDGIVKIQKILDVKNLYELSHVQTLHHIHQSLKAHTLFQKDVDYVVKENQIIIVDEFTGRLKTGSRWSDGLHQAVEAKEGVPVKNENQTLASITFQNYFRLYSKLAGMTGTAETESEEFMKIYKLDVVVIPTHLPMVRIDNADLIYKNKKAKYEAVANLIGELHKKGQPVLVGTISIDSSELLSKHLTNLSIPHEVLNAKQHEREAQIVAKAGEKGSVTIATNMAGRGTDIKLTPETVELGGLFIIGTERHESRRIDNQLRGRSGRQGDPGASRFFLSLEDDLMRIFGSERISGIMGKLGMEENEPIEHKMISNAIANAQKRVEAHNFDIRKHLLDFDNVMNEQRKVIYSIRKEILNDEGNKEFIEEMIHDVADDLVEKYRPQDKRKIEDWPWEDINTGFQNTFRINNVQLNGEICVKEFQSDLSVYFYEISKKFLDEKLNRYDPLQVKNALRELLLSVFDHFWKDHLLNMDHMKEGINLRAYAQKDPLNEYKMESFSLFENMRMEIKKSVVENVFGLELYTMEELEELKRQHEAYLKAQFDAHQKLLKDQEQKAQRIAQIQAKAAVQEFKSTLPVAEKPGRNEPCHCGSGKKFKHCHGA
jgi:preprotein translocase subunit SecA